MIKYWNKARIEQVKKSRKRREEEELRSAKEAIAAARRKKPRTPRGQADLIFNALALPIRRAMLRRLRKGGAMSASHLAEPFRIILPATLKHILALEHAGLITTHKRGRIRFCVYEPAGFNHLAKYLNSKEAFKE